MVLDRVLTDVHHPGNVFSGMALGCQLQYLLFADCQGVARCRAVGAFCSRYWRVHSAVSCRRWLYAGREEPPTAPPRRNRNPSGAEAMAPPERAGVTAICSAMTRPPDTTKILPHELTLLYVSGCRPLSKSAPGIVCSAGLGFAAGCAYGGHADDVLKLTSSMLIPSSRIHILKI